MSRFEWPVRVYWEDTDAGGVVYHAQYLAFMERARSEWVRDLLGDQRAVKSTHGIVFVVRAMQLDFRSPARLDDALTVSVMPTEFRGASLLVNQTVERDGVVLVEARVRVASVDAETFRPAPIPVSLIDTLKNPRNA